MLRRVLALAAIGVLPVLPASAVELITFPTLASGTLAFVPTPFATLNIDWLSAFAPEGDAAALAVDFQFYDFLSGTPVAGGISALIGLAELTEPSNSPATLRHDEIGPAAFDF